MPLAGEERSGGLKEEMEGSVNDLLRVEAACSMESGVSLVYDGNSIDPPLYESVGGGDEGRQDSRVESRVLSSANLRAIRVVSQSTVQ